MSLCSQRQEDEQSMNIINQPSEYALGFQLIEKLQSTRYSDFRFIVAYAKTSGVNRLLPYMRQFKTLGGRVFGVVGIDQNNTSYEALVSLQAVCDELYIYHSEDIMRTFHVKAYHFSGAEENWLAIGSNNFTAGGLFSNYEASISNDIDSVQNEAFLHMFASYSDIQSPCCKRADVPFIESLIENHYVQREQALARQRIAETGRRHTHNHGRALFGRDPNTTLLPPAGTPAQNVAYTDRTAVQPAENQRADITEVEQGAGDKDYLIRHVPGAGTRSKQVHFTMDILTQYFRMQPGSSLDLQQMDDIYTPHPIEHRRIVYSQRNRNVKIEIAAAEILNNHYPQALDKRPILVFKRINPTMFAYMLLMDGDAGYANLNQRLLGLDWHSRSLPYETVDIGTMLTIWDDCPLV